MLILLLNVVLELLNIQVERITKISGFIMVVSYIW
jgi:hypothetical protein